MQKIMMKMKPLLYLTVERVFRTFLEFLERGKIIFPIFKSAVYCT